MAFAPMPSSASQATTAQWSNSAMEVHVTTASILSPK